MSQSKTGTSEEQKETKDEQNSPQNLPSKELEEGDLYATKGSKLPPNLIAFRDQAFEKLISQIDFETASFLPPEELRKHIINFIGEYAEETNARISYQDQRQIAADITHAMVGLGPLELLLIDPTITDIMVNGLDSVYIEQKGKLKKTDLKFRSDQQIMQVARRIASEIGRRIDEASPMLDARLKDGSRVNIIISPLALNGTTISIRRFSQDNISLREMVAKESLSAKMCQFLQVAATSRLNIIVSGGTGAGKTTLLNALSQLISHQERVVTIEDAAELRLQQPHVVRLESRPPNIEGEGQVTIRDLLRNALRMRPDRIVIGECRGTETFDMLQAMNTGHDGSMSTLHANSALEALNRMENMVMMSGYDLPTTVIKNYIVGAIDLIVHVARMRDGTRRVTQITDVMEYSDGKIKCQDVFAFKFKSMDSHGKIMGEYQCMNKDLSFREKISYAGLDKELELSLE